MRLLLSLIELLLLLKLMLQLLPLMELLLLSKPMPQLELSIANMMPNTMTGTI